MNDPVVNQEPVLFERADVDIICAPGKFRSVPALIHPFCPGLAVTMGHFGGFALSVLPSGYAVTPAYERSDSACQALAKWASVGRLCGIDWRGVDSGWAVKDRLMLHGHEAVPFEGSTITAAGGVTRPMTIREWFEVATSRVSDFLGEFPWEDECPAEVAINLINSLGPPLDR